MAERYLAKGVSMFGKSAEKSSKMPDPRHEQVNGLLDKGCSFEGKLTFDGTVQINGEFRGEIYSDGTLIIGADARVHAGIFVDTLVVYGKIEGRIDSKSRIDMRGQATVHADIKTKHLRVEDGVIFQGMCQMDTDAAAPRQLAPFADSPADPLSEEEDNNVLVM